MILWYTCKYQNKESTKRRLGYFQQEYCTGRRHARKYLDHLYRTMHFYIRERQISPKSGSKHLKYMKTLKVSDLQVPSSLSPSRRGPEWGSGSSHFSIHQPLLRKSLLVLSSHSSHLLSQDNAADPSCKVISGFNITVDCAVLQRTDHTTISQILTTGLR